MKKLIYIFLLVTLSSETGAKEFHVSPKGSDKNEGSISAPLKTISAAANLAGPGDVVIVHEGIYRERITPPRGGDSDLKRIVYRAAGDGKAEVKGSEVITGWKKIAAGVWRVAIPNSFFGKYNPYKDLIYGDWFNDYMKRKPHTGEVYLNGKSLFETNLIGEVLNPEPLKQTRDQDGSLYTWYCESNEENTYIYANFHDYDPNKELVEINVRESCFYPSVPGINFITIDGFEMSQAATQWAAPTAEQIGLIGTHWSKGWIIDNNTIHDSKCSGITLGKDRKTGHNVWLGDPSKPGNVHYNEVIARALADGWSKEKIGSHTVRNNKIYNCEQTGICGSMGAAFSRITNNDIYNIWTKRLFTGAEIGGIKIHGSIDLLIKNNRLFNVGRALWMDWMAQGTHITANLCYDNTIEDLFIEVNHGPCLVDNNIFLSETGLQDWSEGGAFIHNLIAGKIIRNPGTRNTPFHKPHSTELSGLKNISGGDNRFYNNIFVAGKNPVPPPDEISIARERKTGYGIDIYNDAELPCFANGNIYYKGAKHFQDEKNYIFRPEFDPQIRIVEEGDGIFLFIRVDKSIKSIKSQLITTAVLGKAVVPGQAFENFDGLPLSVDSDYFGRSRNKKNPTPGPFENPGPGELKLKVW